MKRIQKILFLPLINSLLGLFVNSLMSQSYDSIRYDMIPSNVHLNSLTDFNTKGFNADTLSKPLYCQAESMPTFVTNWSKGNNYNAYISKATNVLDAGSFYAVAGVYTKKTYDLSTHVVRIKGAFVCRTTTVGDYNEHWLGAIPSTNKNYHPLVYGTSNTPEGYLVGAWVDWWMARTRNDPFTADKTFIARENCNMPLGLFFESMAEFKIVHDSIVLSTYKLSAIDGSITQTWKFQKEIKSQFEPITAAPWFKKFRPAFLPDDGLDWVEIVADPLPCTIELRKQNNSTCKSSTGSFNLLNFIWLKSQSIDTNTGAFYIRNCSTAEGATLKNKRIYGGRFSYSNPAGKYTIAYISPCGDSTSFDIEITKISTEVSLHDTILCAGSIFSPNPNLTVDPATIKSYTWTMGSLVGTTSRPIWTLNTPGNYTLSLTIVDNKNCSGIFTSNVSVKTSPLSVITISDTILCKNLQPFFASANTPGDPTASIAWELNPMLPKTSKNITISYPNSGKYTIKLFAVTKDGCKDSSIKKLTVSDAPDVIAFDSQFCEDQPIFLRFYNSTVGQSIKTYSWKIPSINATTNTGFTGIKSGSYPVIFTLENTNGCTSADTVTLVVNPKPTFSATANLVNLDPQGSLWNFIYSGVTPFKAFWYRDNQLFSTQKQSFTKTIFDTGYSYFKIVVVSDKGCADSSYFNLYLPKSTQIFTPNAFTPGKDGKNDFFGPYNYQTLSNFEMKVFNRWGELIFISSPLKPLWDGTDSYGEPAMDGHYVYMFTGLQLNKQWLHANGTVTLLRR